MPWEWGRVKRLQQEVCFRSRDGTGGIGFGGEKRSEDLKLVYLLHWPTFFPGWVHLRVPRVSLLEIGMGLS